MPPLTNLQKFEISILMVGIPVLVVMLIKIVVDQVAYGAFLREHCAVVEMNVVVHENGFPRDRYECDDGVIRWRSSYMR